MALIRHHDYKPYSKFKEDISDFFHENFFKDGGWYEFSHERKIDSYFISDSDVDDMKKKI